MSLFPYAPGSRRLSTLLCSTAACALVATACSSSTSTPAAAPTTAAPTSSGAAASSAGGAAASSPAPAASAAAPVASSPAASPAAAASGGASPVASASALAAAVPTPSFQVGNPSSAQTLQESGSTLLLPYLQQLADPFHSAYSNITLEPSGGGSGKGISDATAGNVQLGGSDAYLSDQQAQQYPTLLNIPIAISSQAINYNLPGISNLKLSGDVLAQIYEGHITTWNDAAIASLNPGVNLPSTPIIPVRRVDSSGDTFIFTSLLTATNQEWSSGPNMGTSVTWPAVSSEVTGNGNPDMVQVCQQNPGCIAYVGISVESTAQQANLGEAMLQNKNGNFVQPTPDTVAAAVAAGSSSIPDDLRQSLIYEPGDQSYPIVNYEYLMADQKQSDANMALALRTFYAWAIDPARGASQSNLSSVSFVALPAAVISKVDTAVARIGS